MMRPECVTRMNFSCQGFESKARFCLRLGCVANFAWLYTAAGALALPPGNDNYRNAIHLSPSTTQVQGSNNFATKELGEPNHAGNVGGRSVWWSWDAPNDGTLVVQTDGSNFDTLLGVYTGVKVSELTTIASNDDFRFLFTSHVALQTLSGTTYHIAVDGKNSATGHIILSLSFTPPPPPANDNFSNRIGLSGSNVTV